MKITFLGHACFLIDINNIQIIFDPFISDNELARHIDINTIHVDYLLLSHGHDDHIADVAPIYKNNPKATLIAVPEIVKWFEKKGISKKRTYPMNIGGKCSFPFGIVRMVHAVHSNSLSDSTYGGTAVGFIINNKEKTLYFSGDTALHQDMKQINRYSINYALLPIGGTYTMNMEDALIAADYVGTKKIIGMHYDTFPMIKIDKTKAKALAINAGKELILMDIGTSLEL